MTNKIEQMFSEVRQNLKDERESIVNKVKEDILLAKKKALMTMH